MKKSTDEIRQMFLDFFHKKGHRIVSSSSLIPDNDSTLLFTNAGMNQFKDVFLGLSDRNYSRATTSQRCVRAGGKHNDLENVGYTTRHHTFFEMLGNFSFGDYFKKDAIKYAWELLTSKNWFALPKERLWITVYENDNKTYEIWKKEIGVSSEHIICIGDKKGDPYTSENFWTMGDTGPCGPCTEIFYDRGNNIIGGLPGSTEEKGDRYIEIWNIVFMQFNRHVDGTMSPLPKPSVDTGMGLERIAAVLQHVGSNYRIDLFQTLIKAITKYTKTTDLNNKSLNVIADHIRSCAFLIADGVTPSNESRGYVLRRIIRRALRHGNMIGAKEAFFHKLVKPLIHVMGSVGNELKHQQTLIETVLKAEEERFVKTLERGLILLNKEIENIENNSMLQGRTAFRLYDTYGFPIDLTKDICRERNITVDIAGFKVAMEEQQRSARKSSTFSENYNSIIHIDSVTQFKGYNQLKLDSKISFLFSNEEVVNRINIGQDAIVFLEETSFYAESGGQIGDQGEIYGNNFTFIVTDTRKYGKAIGHIGKLSFGSMKVGESVNMQVNEVRRKQISLNHTATHLIHAALRKVLGDHVVQKGSLITEKILRFDFLHFKAIEISEIHTIEDLVNAQIRQNLPIKATIMNLNIAKKKGVVSLFNEKYGERVRILSIGNFSTELCIGTHALRTGDIGLLHIFSENVVSSGVHRIEAVTGENAIMRLHSQNDQFREVTCLLKGNIQNLGGKVRNMLERTHSLEKEVQKLKEQIAIYKSENLLTKTIVIKGTKLLVSTLTEVEPKMMRIMVDYLKNRLGSIVIVLATLFNHKVFIITRVSEDLTDRIKAEELIKMLAKKIKGKGGGRSDIAEAGSSDKTKLPVALASVKGWVTTRL